LNDHRMGIPAHPRIPRREMTLAPRVAIIGPIILKKDTGKALVRCETRCGPSSS
jgi:hypothetical protein